MMPPTSLPSGSDDRTRRYTPAWSDGLGDRVLLFDVGTGTSLELLRFKPEFSGRPDFEAALRKRAAALAQLRHPSLATLRSVERVENNAQLVLVSQHVAGRRLSEILPNARGPAFALEFIRQITPALSALQGVAPGVAHGVLTADRVIVTREGRLVVVENCLGPAVESLRFMSSWLRSDLGLAVPEGGTTALLDQRLDVVQLGFIALSLLLGRRLDPAEFRVGIPKLLNEFQDIAPVPASVLRPWLERALQMTERPFQCALDAAEAIGDLPKKLGLDASELEVAGMSFSTPADPASVEPAKPTPVPAPAPMAAARPRPVNEVKDIETAEDTMKVRIASPVSAKPAPPLATLPPPLPPLPRSRQTRAFGALHWAAAGITLVAGAEAVVIASLLSNAPAPMKTVTIATPPPAVSYQPNPTPLEHATEAAPVAPQPPSAPAIAEPATAAPAPAPLSGRFGGVKVSSPIELQVFENGTLVGSSAAPIALTEGAHTFDVVNEVLAYRARQTVTVKPGQMATLTIALPQGRININAAPWASVSIDGNPAGDTPIANVSLTIGNHEILFRHPQLGEQRMTAVVKAEGVTRVSASFQR